MTNILPINFKWTSLDLIILLLIGNLITRVTLADYRIGIGKADVTGPVVEIPFMGYAKLTQKGTGLHLRQFARAFIIESGTSSITFISVDASMIGHGVKKQVIQDLQRKYENIYNNKNVIISGTHTHSAPGGFMIDLLFDITTFGFVKDTFNALVSGIVNAVIKAHESKQSAKIFMNSGILLEANINRSPAAYLQNPLAERHRYKYNVDKEMTQLQFRSASDYTLLGVINWFPVHPTSMNNTNTLVSSDNVGYASILLEKDINNGTNGSFVAAFSSTNLGDVSPNIRGPHCINTGEPCDTATSSCNGNSQLCIASGPGRDMFESTDIISKRLYEVGLGLLKDGNAEEISGEVIFAHRFVNMTQEVGNYTLANGTIVKFRGCCPALGYSFAAGTTDGPGEFDFKQGTVTGNLLWNKIRNFIAAPTVDDINCHHPKPILLATGRIKYPYRWQSSIVTIQVAIIGNVVIAAVPGEFTSMSGRRLKDSINDAIQRNGGSSNCKVIIAGLSNAYSDYVVTPEEYEIQRYEAASTIFGPYTLPLYQNLYSGLIDSMMKNEVFEAGTEPPDPTDLISLIPPVLFDWAGLFSNFGDCIKQPNSVVKRGQTVIAKFVAGNPRNDVMHGKTFLQIEQRNDNNEWIVTATDADWETKFHWRRVYFLTGQSQATVEWNTNNDTAIGLYRIRHFGNYKSIIGNVYSYDGLSHNFKVI